LGAIVVTIVALVMLVPLALIVGFAVSDAVQPKWIGIVLAVVLLIAGILLALPSAATKNLYTTTTTLSIKKSRCLQLTSEQDARTPQRSYGVRL
jgi:hypothetical protein